jgi:hypothetical protein
MARCSGDLLPPSPPCEEANAGKHETRQSSTNGRTGNCGRASGNLAVSGFCCRLRYAIERPNRRLGRPIRRATSHSNHHYFDGNNKGPLQETPQPPPPAPIRGAYRYAPDPISKRKKKNPEIGFLRISLFSASLDLPRWLEASADCEENDY